MTTRARIVQEARNWIDSPFHHQGRLKGVGVDCAGLVIGIARELGIVAPDFNVAAYPRSPDGETLMHLAEIHLTPIAEADMQPGDVIVVAVDREPQHIGVLGDYRHGGLSIIHAASNAGFVIETRLMFNRTLRFVAAFSFPEVE